MLIRNFEQQKVPLFSSLSLLFFPLNNSRKMIGSPLHTFGNLFISSNTKPKPNKKSPPKGSFNSSVTSKYLFFYPEQSKRKGTLPRQLETPHIITAGAVCTQTRHRTDRQCSLVANLCVRPHVQSQAPLTKGTRKLHQRTDSFRNTP
jgi:hypothetical protein